MSDEIETIDKNPKSWAAWKREAERLQAIIDDMVLAAMDSEPVAYISKSDFDAGYPHILARRDFNKACTMAVYA
ncbi:hypothetical protein LAN29_25580, partial [Mycobacterium tuberculosis]|nr:hypothetical protein [Mycobacterium tuberculosis]